MVVVVVGLVVNRMASMKNLEKACLAEVQNFLNSDLFLSYWKFAPVY